MPDVLQIGPFNMKTTMVMAVVSLLLGLLATQYRLKHEKEFKKAIIETLSNSVLLAFLVWKFSYVLFHPLKVLDQPVSMLYFSGGEKGTWLAGIVVILYVLMKGRKLAIPGNVFADAIATGFLTAWGVGHLLLAFMDGADVWYDVQQSVFSTAFLIWFIRSKRSEDLEKWLDLTLWFSISQIYVLFFPSSREPQWLGLSHEQLFMFLLAIAALVAGHFRSPVRRNEG